MIASIMLSVLLISSLAVTLVHRLIFEQHIAYSFNGSELADILRVFATNMLLAFVFGLAFRNSALAIVSYFIVPPITITLGQLPHIGEYASWLSLGHSSSLFIAGYQAQEPVQICISTFLWIAIPLLIGLYMNTKDYQER